MSRAMLLFTAVAVATMAACSTDSPKGEAIDPQAVEVSLAPSCNGMPATIFVNGEGFWVRPAGSAVVQLNGGGYRITGTSSDDVIMGSDLDDVILSGAGNDIVCAGSGDDVIEDVAGDDLLFGDDGDDAIYAGSGNDRVDGGRGRDRLMGGPGIDELFGGRGMDALWGDSPSRPFQARDAALGGPGEDFCSADIMAECES